MKGAPAASLTPREIARAWWPLAASWLLMSAELPALSAVVARLPDAEVHLAAWGGIVFPIALLFEAPIIMMLAASTALSRDLGSYRYLGRFADRVGLALSLLHGLVAFTPLYDLLVVGVLGPPEAIVEPGRMGLRIMTLWAFAIADRRFQQGALIRFGRSRAVGLGTLLRIVVTSSALLAGWLVRLPGIAVAAGAIATGVLAEMLYARLAVLPLVRGPIAAAPPVEPPLRLGPLLAFYVPLALTPLFTLLGQPIGSGAIARMPQALPSLAVWPVVNGLVFLLRSPGIALNEVVVSHAERPGAARALARFSGLLSIAVTLVLLGVALTPLAEWWFGGVCGLDPRLVALARESLPFALVLPATSVWQSYYQGRLVHQGRTRGVTEAVALYLAVSAIALGAGVAWGRLPGVVTALVAFSLGALAQTFWARRRLRSLAPRVPLADAEAAPEGARPLGVVGVAQEQESPAPPVADRTGDGVELG